ncbi:ZWICHEL kinesin-like calmodulin-binding protein, partial [Prunus dulcis]
KIPPLLATTATSCRRHHHHTQPLGAAPGPFGTTTFPTFHSIQPPPRSARRALRNQPRKAAVWTDFTKLSTLRSLSFLHQIGRVRHQEPDRILKGDLRGIEAVEVRGIHHRANYSFRAKGKKDIVPDIRQVSDTHRTWLEFQRGIGSGPVTINSKV